MAKKKNTLPKEETIIEEKKEEINKEESKEAEVTAESLGLKPVKPTFLNTNLQPSNHFVYVGSKIGQPGNRNSSLESSKKSSTPGIKAPRIIAIINMLEEQFRERMHKLGLGNSIDDAGASEEEKNKWCNQRDEFIGRELFRNYGWEDFITFTDGFAMSSYWNNKAEFMRPCNAYNGTCRFDCSFLQNEQECPYKGQGPGEELMYGKY